MTVCGIYRIICTGNLKFYIGSSNDIYRRFKKEHLKNNKHPNNFVQHTFNKYGLELFQLEVIELCDSQELLEREQYYLDLYFNDDLCMNINPQAKKPPGTKGIIVTQETKEKLANLCWGKQKGFQRPKNIKKK